MERFEGRLFVSWIAANLQQDNYLKIMLTEQVRAGREMVTRCYWNTLT